MIEMKKLTPMQSYELLDLLVLLATYPDFLDFPLTWYLTTPFNRTIQVILYKEDETQARTARTTLTETIACTAPPELPYFWV